MIQSLLLVKVPDVGRGAAKNEPPAITGHPTPGDPTNNNNTEENPPKFQSTRRER